jgi:hypothetical protein
MTKQAMTDQLTKAKPMQLPVKHRLAQTRKNMIVVEFCRCG